MIAHLHRGMDMTCMHLKCIQGVPTEKTQDPPLLSHWLYASRSFALLPSCTHTSLNHTPPHSKGRTGGCMCISGRLDPAVARAIEWAERGVVLQLPPALRCLVSSVLTTLSLASSHTAAHPTNPPSTHARHTRSK